MSGERALRWTLIVFSVSLGGVGLAAMSAWARCAAPGACSTELALSIAALAPTVLILALMLLLLRARTASPFLRRLLLIFLFGIASAPLSAFLLRDLGIVAIVALLLSVGVGIALYSDAVTKTPSRGPDEAWLVATERAAPAEPQAGTSTGFIPPNFEGNREVPRAAPARAPELAAVVGPHRARETAESLSQLTARLQRVDNLTVSLVQQIDRLIVELALTSCGQVAPLADSPRPHVARSVRLGQGVEPDM